MGTQLVAQALLPLNFALEALLLAVLLRRIGRRRLARVVAVVGVAVLWLAATPVVADALLRGLERRYDALTVDSTPTADAIVVLGGAVGPARPPRIVADLGESADRVLHAARLFRAGKAPIVVVTGGSSDPAAPESKDFADLLVEWGVPPGAILAEQEARNTAENASYTKRLLDAHGAKRVLLVTSALHMPRAVATFRAAGIDVLPCPTDFWSVDPVERTVLDWVPDATALQRSTAVVHEWLGWGWYRIRSRA